jgi:uncharacterized protein YchJ
MAPRKTYYRFWCSKCQDFTLQEFDSDCTCSICGTITKSYKISEVPEEKIMEQRQRYNDYKKLKYKKMLGSFLNPTMSIFEEMALEDAGLYNPYEPVIVETDAGQKSIDDRDVEESRKIAKQHEAERNALKEEFLKFKNLGRNDVCACGSGKKYKQCCISKYYLFA